MIFVLITFVCQSLFFCFSSCSHHRTKYQIRKIHSKYGSNLIKEKKNLLTHVFVSATTKSISLDCWLHFGIELEVIRFTFHEFQFSLEKTITNYYEGSLTDVEKLQRHKLFFI